MLSEQQIADGWKLHDGGECPVDGETFVVAKYRGGAIGRPIRAKFHEWSNCDEAPFADIIAYKEQSHD